MFLTQLWELSYVSYSLAVGILLFGAFVIAVESLRGIIVFSCLLTLHWVANSVAGIWLALSDLLYQSIITKYATAPDTSRSFLISTTTIMVISFNVATVVMFTLYVLILLYHLRKYYVFLKAKYARPAILM